MHSTAMGKVLLVTEEPLSESCERGILEKHGYQVEKARTVQEGLEILEQSPGVDLILLDTGSKGMSEVEFGKKILERFDLPLVFMVSSSSPKLLEKIQDITPYGCFSQGLDETTLISYIRMVLRFWQSQRAAREKELELKESEERFAQAFKSSPAPQVISDIHTGRIIDVNDRWLKMLGYSRQEIVGRTSKEIGIWAEPGERDRIVQKVKDYGYFQDEYIEFRTKDNQPVLGLWSAVAINLGGRQVMLSMIYDITERKRAEQELQESESLLRSITDAALDAILMMDSQGRISFWNPAAESIFGYQAQEVMGRDLHFKLAPERYLPDYQRNFPEFQRTGRGNVVGKTLELEAVRKDGEEIPVSLSVSAFQRKGHWNALGILRDVTERKRAEEVLVRAKEEAESANKAKSEFLANMSHEIRTPLNGIMGMMQLLQMSSMDSEQEEYVSQALTSAYRLSQLLSDILDISRMESGGMDVYETEFSVKELCDSISELFMNTAREKGLTLECSLDPNMPEELIGDKARVRQILYNLVGNALKFTEEGGVKLEISPLSSSRNQEQRVLFTVEDTGTGISEDIQDSLFQPFTQVDGSYTRKYQGAGLGLSIVRRLVELMQGNISLESAPGQGTAVHVVLPFQSSSKTLRREPRVELAGPARATNGLHVLYAEDEPTHRLMVERMLGKLGYEVTLVENGKQVLEALAEQDFDCILMDIQMPVMDGVETTRRIRGAEREGGVARERLSDGETEGSESLDSSIPESPNPRIPIIALTAYAQSGDREKLLEAGMNDYLSKPVGMEELKQVLEKYRRQG